MSWKNWPYWLKGGLIGIGISIILMIVIFLKFGSHFDGLIYSFFLASLPTGFLLIHISDILSDFICSYCFLDYIFLFGNIIVNWFLIVAIIGWIYGKVKSKSKKK